MTLDTDFIKKLPRFLSRLPISSNTFPSLISFPYLLHSSEKTVTLSKDEPKWKIGIWVGFIDHSNEHIVATSRGIIKCRAIKRKDITEQFLDRDCNIKKL